MPWRILTVGCLIALLAGCGETEQSTDSTGFDVTDATHEVTIRFERHGGIGGISRAVDVSTEDMSAEQAAELRSLLAEADFFALPAEITGDSVVMDDFNYVIAVDMGDRQSTVRTSGAAAPDSLRPLLDWLNRALRSGGG